MSVNSPLNFAFPDDTTLICTSVQKNTVYSTASKLSHSQNKKKTIDGRNARSLDLRIGLNLLGEEGTLHLLNYIKVKSQSKKASLAEQHKVACS